MEFANTLSEALGSSVLSSLHALVATPFLIVVLVPLFTVGIVCYAQWRARK
jgi:hypothetical protein